MEDSEGGSAEWRFSQLHRGFKKRPYRSANRHINQ